ncbi:sensor histidine kinase, partial [Bacillus thuringiensis]|nr:sensor histidine kinase [Bacillus thuringiensis]
IESKILSRTTEIIRLSLAVLVVEISGGILLAGSIRKNTLSLGPNENAALYQGRSAILLSIKEGIIASDQSGFITMITTSAEEMLHINGDYM